MLTAYPMEPPMMPSRAERDLQGLVDVGNNRDLVEATNLDEPVGAERRNPHRERRGEATRAAVALEERRERAFLLVGVGVAHHGRSLVDEAHFEAHGGLPDSDSATSTVRRAACGLEDAQPV